MKTKKTKTRAYTQLILGIVLTLLSAQSYAVERKVFYHNNLLGSPVAATDESGNLCWREDYRPYGEKIRSEDQGCGLDDNVVGYTGHVHDGDIGLTYMQARYYDPVVGRFMGVDPVGFSSGDPTTFSKFAYANNNPIRFLDPTGMSTGNTGSDEIGTVSNHVQGPGSESYGLAEGKIDDLSFYYEGTWNNNNMDYSSFYNAMNSDAASGRVESLTPAIIETLSPDPFSKSTKVGELLGLLVAIVKNRKIEKVYQHNYKYHPRIRERGVEDPKAHNFPYSFDDHILKAKPVKQKDGSLLYSIPGTMNETTGRFEIAINPDTATVFHRTFVSDK